MILITADGCEEDEDDVIQMDYPVQNSAFYPPPNLAVFQDPPQFLSPALQTSVLNTASI